MQSNLGQAKNSILRALSAIGSTVVVYWQNVAGGTEDVVTGAVEGGVESTLSGTLKCFMHQEQARTVQRTYQEIQTGDLIIDLAPAATVDIVEGQSQSGTVTLDEIADQGVRFRLNDQWFVQAEIGEDLAAKWNVTVADQQLMRTILLRKAT